MLPTIDKIEPFLDKETRVQRSFLDLLDDLVAENKLDFEYLSSIGDPDTTKKVFDVVVAESNSETISKHTAKVQTLGGIHGIYVMSYLVHNFYAKNAQYYLPQANVQRYDAIKGYDNPTEIYTDLESLSFNALKDDSILVINSAFLAKVNFESVFSEQAINILNNKSIQVFLDIDQLDLSNLVLPSYTLRALLAKAAAPVGQLFAKIDNVSLSLDTGKILFMEGLNFGHLFLKFQSEEQAQLFEKAVSVMNRTTLSTPVKLGVDIVKALFENEDKYGQVISQLTEPAFK